MGYKHSSKTFDELVALSGWDETQGPYPGVFSKMPAGERCLWSTLWIDDIGLVNPLNVGPNNPEAWRYEMQDIAARGYTEAAQLLRDGYEANPTYWAVFIKQARANYRGEYAFPFTAKAPQNMWPKLRDGWPRPYWAPLP